MDRSIRNRGEAEVILVAGGGFVLVLVLVVVGMLLLPKYDVYRKTLSGEAKLREAEYTRKIAIEEAKAAKEAAKSLAEAEVERAQGVAEANKIIGESLRENEAYLRYLWIQGLHDGSSEVIYIPTEANLPILEAGRFQRTGGD